MSIAPPPPLTWNLPGLVETINRTTVNQSVGPSSVTGYWKIATLVKPSTATQDVIEIRMMCGQLDGTSLTVLDYIAQNRTITNQYTRVGPAQTKVGIQRYQETDGSASIYAVSVAAGSVFWSMNWSVTFSNADVTLYIPPLGGDPTPPPGVINWSTLNEVTYPPLFKTP